jgi:putrescine aminotransferase
VFSNSGSEANETALKILRAYHKLIGKPNKRKILTRTFSYHGVTLATTSMTGLPSCYQPFDLPLDGFIHVPGPYAFGAGKEADPEGYASWCLDETRRIIEAEGPETIAAFFAEPVQGAGGVIPPPGDYLEKLRALCRDYGILFVADEVITGFGRLGEWFGSHKWNLDPDMICVAKGLSSGYLPLGGTLVSQEIAGTLQHGGYFAHGFTYSGHPVTCAAAMANLDIIEREDLVRRTREVTGPFFQQKLAAIAAHPRVGEVRGVGLIGAIELLTTSGEHPAADANFGVRAASKVREEGAIVRGIRNLLAMAPPLVVTEPEIDELFESIERGLNHLN